MANPVSDLTYTVGKSGNNVTLTVAWRRSNPVWNGEQFRQLE